MCEAFIAGKSLPVDVELVSTTAYQVLSDVVIAVVEAIVQSCVAAIVASRYTRPMLY